MATQSQIDSTYNYMDRVWRVCIGDFADISGAMYNGDFTISLTDAQQKKHRYIIDQTNLRPGGKIFDVGCGWGAFLKTVRDSGMLGVGVTLSSKQAQHCQLNGLNVYLQDWKDITTERFGGFDAIASMGAFEHFCSDVEFIDGRQNEIYDRFFRLCSALLPSDGRMFLQTMTFDKYVPDPRFATIDAREGSDDYIIGLLRKFYPGSWLPAGLEHIEQTAKPYFSIVTANSGREDYIETIDQWNRLLGRASLKKALAMLQTVPYYFKDADLKYKLESNRRNCNQECFRRRLMNHYRIILQKKE